MVEREYLVKRAEKPASYHVYAKIKQEAEDYFNLYSKDRKGQKIHQD